MLTLDANIRYLKGVGDKRAAILAKLGVTTVADLLYYFPRSYEDRRVRCAIAELVCEQVACVKARVITVPRTARIPKNRTVSKLQVSDDTGVLDIVFFNQKYAASSLRQDTDYVFYGKVSGNLTRLEMVNPQFERADLAGRTGGIVPVYPLTAGVGQKMVQSAVQQALQACGHLLEECLPEPLRKKYDLMGIHEALSAVHFPPDFEKLAEARRRLGFEELFVLVAGLALIKKRRTGVQGRKLSAVDMAPFFAALPYALTPAQHRCLADALGDMISGQLMNRLIQGDVGSGKTALAAACAYFVCTSGFQCAYMAPTEILAEQHYKNLAPLLEGLGIPCTLLTGGMKAKVRRAAEEAIALGQAGFVIGTHALISQKIAFHDLALVITDEQHRFGVSQRAALAEKGENPHILVMSATPIPRTLALILYGDLDVSILDELPPGRTPVKTYAVDEGYRVRINAFIRRQVEQGRQVFIVCPAVEESEMTELTAAEELYARLSQKTFPDLRVGLVHGRMKTADKDAVMGAFAAGKLDILVATTVIEVGVDVPNATLMVVENADRFGLSQLHQLRGRVGRGSWESYCVLFRGSDSEAGLERLKILEKTSNGFVLAEEDLRLRGPGDFFGNRQHGLPQLKAADLATDVRLLTQAREAAEAYLQDEGAKAFAPLQRRIAQLFSNQSSFN